MPPRLTTAKFIEKARQVHGDEFDYTKVEYIDGKTPITIICREHGEFRPWPSTFLRGSGCKPCKVRKSTLEVIKRSKEQFVAKAMLKHGERYDYSLFDYQRNDLKTIILCAQHGEFMITPNNHLNGRGCPSCAKDKRAQALIARKFNKENAVSLTDENIREYLTKSFIEEAFSVHGNLYDYTNSEYINTKTKVAIICNKHGQFMQIPTLHLTGSGCKKCADIKKGRKKAKIAGAKFIEKAREIHDNSYGYEKLAYVRSSDKVIITCYKHGDFALSPNSHLGGIGCAICGTERAADKRRMTIDEFISKANKVHDNLYDYSKSDYVSAHKSIIIICDKHGEFPQAPSGHLAGRGCKTCGHDRTNASKRYDTDKFIEEAKVIHGEFYDYLLVDYKGSAKPVIVTCPKHGSFPTTYEHHIKRGQSCPSCKNRDMDTVKFIERSRECHGVKYDYSMSNYTTAKSQISIICPDHGEFKQVAWNHMSGIGCRNCFDLLNSKGAKRIISWLTDNNIEFVREKTFDNLFTYARSRKYLFRYDFFISSYNLLIEYDGQQHFKSVDIWGGDEAFKRLQVNDQKKNLWAENNGYKLLRIAYSDFDNIEKILSEHITIK